MRLHLRLARIAAIAVTALASSASAQGTQVALASGGPVIGSDAPDFSLPGATRYGLLNSPVHLADHRGETVVLAFFYQARTKG